MGKDPDLIREEIEETRSHMTETVEALGYKADVKSRVKDSISGQEGRSREQGHRRGTRHGADEGRRAEGEGGRAEGRHHEEQPTRADGRRCRCRLPRGLLLPSTKVEDDKLGEVADQVKDKAKETGQEALDRGKQVVQEAGGMAKEAAKESGQEQGKEMAESLRQSAKEVASSGSPGA